MCGRIYDDDGRKESRFKCYYANADSKGAPAKLFEGHMSKNLPFGVLLNPERV